MSKRTVALIALAILAALLFINRSTLSFQHLVVPALGVGFVIWFAIRRGLWQTLVSAIQSKPELKSRYSHPVMEPKPLPQFEPPPPVQKPQTIVNALPPPVKVVPAVKRGWTPIVYTVKVPKDTEWRPEMTVALIRELVPLGSVALRIASVGHEIQWQVLDMGKTPLEAGLIAQVVRKVYPHAEITKSEYEPPPFNGHFYRVMETYQQLQDFVGPIKYPKEFLQSDPLTIVANQMNDLEPGESVAYTIYLGDTQDRYYRDAVKQTKGSNWSFQNVIYITLGFFTIIGSVVSIAVICYKLLMEKKPDKYRESDMNVIYGKLNDPPLVSAYILLEANSPYEERLSHFDIQPALLHYGHEFQKLARSRTNPKIRRIVNAQQDWEMSSLAELGYLIDQPYSRKSNPVQCIFSPSEIASLWHLPHEKFTASNIAWTKGRYAPLPTIMRGKTEGLYLGDNLYGGRRYPVYMLPEDRAGHMIVVGKTGMGKSTLLHNLIRQDIAAGRGVAIIDPSPKDKNIVPRILQQSIPDERKKDVIVLDLSDRETPPPFNILSIPTNVPRRDMVASIRAIFERVYGSNFSEGRMGRTLGMALHTILADETSTVRDIARVSWDMQYREALLDRVTSEGALDFWDRFKALSVGEQEAYFEPILLILT